MKGPTVKRVVATEETVAAECDRLFYAGERITLAAIQAALGGGSPNGIYKHMDTWQRKHRDRFVALEQLEAEPRLPGIPDELWDAIMPVWKALVGQAKAKGEDLLAPQRVALAAQRTQLDAARAQLADSAAQHQAEREKLINRLELANSALETAKGRVAQLEGQHASDAEALVSAGVTNKALDRQLSESRNDFNTQLAAVQSSHTRETDRLRMDIDRERQDFVRREKALQATNQRFEEQLQKKNDETLELHRKLAELRAGKPKAQPVKAAKPAKRSPPLARKPPTRHTLKARS
jgi:predicted nuclease with TOPRIM domain